MGVFKIKPAGDRLVRRKRRRVIQSALLIGLLALAGALLDPALIAPFGPTASRPERIDAQFTRCGVGPGLACVVDGDTLRLGQRRIGLIGIDAPDLDHAQCPRERILAARAADRVVQWLNAGPFDLIGHRFRNEDGHGRDLRLAVRGGESLGTVLAGEGLAHRNYGSKRRWC